MKFTRNHILIGLVIFIFNISQGRSLIEWDLNEKFCSERGNETIRTKRQLVSTHTAAWQSIYLFSIHVARVAGNNALMARVINAMNDDYSSVSRSYTYGYYGGRRRYGYPYGGYGGYGGGYGGYGYGGFPFSQPIIYYVPVSQQTSFPSNGIFDFVSNVGGTVSNTELLDQLITLIQQAIDETYSSYDGAQGATDAPA